MMIQINIVILSNLATMTDEALEELAARVTSSEDQLARDLGLDAAAVRRSRLDRKHVVRNMLCEWRESERAIDLGNRALDALKSLCHA